MGSRRHPGFWFGGLACSLKPTARTAQDLGRPLTPSFLPVVRRISAVQQLVGGTKKPGSQARNVAENRHQPASQQQSSNIVLP